MRCRGNEQLTEEYSFEIRAGAPSFESGDRADADRSVAGEGVSGTLRRKRVRLWWRPINNVRSQRLIMMRNREPKKQESWWQRKRHEAKRVTRTGGGQ